MSRFKLAEFSGCWIFLVALLARLLWVVMMPSGLSWGDEGDYVTIAKGLLLGQGYVSTSLRANPGFPAFLALVFGLFGEHLIVARIAQCVLGAMTCWTIYHIGRLLISRRVGAIAGGYLALYPPHIYLVGVIYTEPLVTFLGAGAIYLAVSSVNDRPRLLLGLLAGTTLGLTVLTRSTFFVVMPCVCLAWLYGARSEWRRYIPLCGLFLLGFTATVLPWTCRNYRTFHRLIPVNTGFQTLLWRGNTPVSRGGVEDRDLMWYSDDWRERLRSLPETERIALEKEYAGVEERVQARIAELGDTYMATDEVLGPIAVRYILTNPGRTLWLAGRKLRTLYSAFSKTVTQNVHTNPRNEFVASVSFYPMLALSLAGACRGWQWRHKLGLLYLVVISYSLISSLLVTATRYRLPLDPYLILFAAVAAEWLWSRIFNSQSPSAEPSN